MTNIHIVGLGLLGGQLALEITKRAAAADRELSLYLYDFDTVEERNIFAQIFGPQDLGKLKADVIGTLCSNYKGVQVTVRPWKITSDNMLDMGVDEGCIVIDAVDNIPTRQLLWAIGTQSRVPVMHVGLSYNGEGLVSWNFQDYDNFPLSPSNIAPEVQVEILDPSKIEDVKLPPCELNESRPAALNTVHAALDALWMYLGHDFSGLIPKELATLQNMPNLMTTWTCSTTSRGLRLTSVSDIKVAV